MKRTITIFTFIMLMTAFGFAQTVHQFYVQDPNNQGYDPFTDITVNVGDEIQFLNGAGGTYNFKIMDINNSPDFVEWSVPNGQEIYSVIIDANYPNSNEITIEENAFPSNYLKTVSINKNTASVSEFNEVITIYPNPVQDVMSISSDVYVKELKIISVVGELVYTGAKLNNIDVSDLNDGVYIIKCILENNQVLTKKFIKN